MKELNDWTIRDFKKLPCRKWREEIGLFDSLVILPTKEIHDSGFRCMDFVAVKDNVPKCRLSGCSDVIHFDGIGGYGYKWLERYHGVPNSIEPKGWSIDCLKKSGLIRIFCRQNIRAGDALSSFEIYGEKEE